MSAHDAGERRGDMKSKLLDGLHDPLQLRILVIGEALAIGYGGVYVPMPAQIDQVQSKLAQDKKLSDLAQNIEHLETQCKKFEKLLPKNTDDKEWLHYIHEGVRLFPLRVVKIEGLAPRKVGPYPVYVFQLELEGTFYDLDAFLRWIETNSRPLRVDSIDLSLLAAKSGGKGKGNKDEMVMKMVVLGMAG